MTILSLGFGLSRSEIYSNQGVPTLRMSRVMDDLISAEDAVVEGVEFELAAGGEQIMVVSVRAYKECRCGAAGAGRRL